MTPDEHRREAASLRRKHPSDPEAQRSAMAHEQIAWVTEMFKRAECLWIATVAILAFYFLAYFWTGK